MISTETRLEFWKQNDDITTLAEKRCDLQGSVNSIFKVGNQLGLVINIDKIRWRHNSLGKERKVFRFLTI